MNFKRLSAILLSLVMLLGLAACSGGTNNDSNNTDSADSTAAATDSGATQPDAVQPDTSQDTETDSDDEYLFTVIAMDSTSQYWLRMYEGAKEAAEEIGGVRVEFMSPEQKDDAMQIEMINNAVANGTDLILLAANGPDVLVSTIQAASEKGVKFVYVDSPANYDAVATVSTDNLAGGRTAGELALKELEARGITSGRIGVVGVQASIDSTMNREKGFREVFEGTDFEFVSTQYCNADVAQAKDITDGYLVDGVICVFAPNDNCATGAAASIEANNVQDSVVAIGFDSNDAIEEYLNKGALVATIVQNPEYMGSEGVHIGVKAMRGEAIEETFVDSGVEIEWGSSALTQG